MSKKRILKTAALALAIATLFGTLAIVSLNMYVYNSTSGNIKTPESATELTGMDCILVLGCGVYEDGTPSPMLEDRLKRGIELYKAGVAPKLLMSGDHGQDSYNEVAVMKAYAIEAGVPSEDIFMDHAGFSTYDSIARAHDVFHARQFVIVTQDYHLYRALYIARRYEVTAYGVNADLRSYGGQFGREVREVLARIKDFGKCMAKPAPTYLGDVIPIDGDGNVTND